MFSFLWVRNLALSKLAEHPCQRHGCVQLQAI